MRALRLQNGGGPRSRVLLVVRDHAVVGNCPHQLGDELHAAEAELGWLPARSAISIWLSSPSSRRAAGAAVRDGLRGRITSARNLDIERSLREASGAVGSDA